MRRGVVVGLPLSMTVGGDVCAPQRFTACGITWDADDIVRFLAKCKWESRVVDGKARRCLIWQGAKSRGGAHRAAGRKAGNKQWYGSFRVKGKTVRAHRFAAVAIFGLRPTSFDEIDHNCYNTLCVFCLECVSKEVNQARIRRGNGDASGKLSAGVLEEGRHHASPYAPFLEFGEQPEHINCRCTVDYPLDPDAD